MTRHRGWRPLAIVAAASVIAAFLGQTGLLVEIGGLALGGLVWWHDRRRFERMLIADYVERHSFPSDTIEDFVTSELGAETLDEARRRQEEWRSGYAEAKWQAYQRRSDAAKRAAATRRRTRG